MTSRTRKLAVLAIVVAAVAVATIALWPKPKVYIYQGKTVEQWFSGYLKDLFLLRDVSSAMVPVAGRHLVLLDAFEAMGTNAAPFLASRIDGDITPSWLELCTSKLPESFQPTPRFVEAVAAADLLRDTIKPPKNMLEGLLASAMLSANPDQSNLAHTVLAGLAGSTNAGQIGLPPTSPLP